jgi:cysteine-rich repeat protein
MHPAKDYKWIRIWGLSIAIAAMAAAGAMSGSCALDTKTTACEQFGLRCKEGEQCAAHQAVCIEIGGCGDGIVDRNKGEVCDDGNIVDGEMNDAGAVITVDQCSHDCKSTQECGNEIVDTNETCDDGIRNGLPNDACNALCQLRDKICGNGLTDPDTEDLEECDPGPKDSAGCNSQSAGSGIRCHFAKCGDRYTNLAAGEECDDGMGSSETCNSPTLCKRSRCGDHIQNTTAHEDCDNGEMDTMGCNGVHNGSADDASCKFPICGDNHLNTAAHEDCDDTNGSDSPTCNGAAAGNFGCRFTSCGDGHTNMAAHEDCDTPGGIDTADCNGNRTHTAGQPPAQINNPATQCKSPQCGDGYVNLEFMIPGTNVRETCDTGGDSDKCNGNANTFSDPTNPSINHTNSPNSRCQLAQCGDGYVNPKFLPDNADSDQKGEECDNGLSLNSNTIKDACRTNCRKAHCGDGIKDTNEQCDNGSNNSDILPNACRKTCHSATCGDGVRDSGEECDMTPCDDNHKTCQENCHCI